jgi:hypothetical protein
MRLNPRGFKRIYIVLCVVGLAYGLWWPVHDENKRCELLQETTREGIRHCSEIRTAQSIDQCVAGWEDVSKQIQRDCEDHLADYFSLRIWPSGHYVFSIVDWAIGLCLLMAVVYWIIVAVVKVVMLLFAWIVAGFRTPTM